MKRVLVCALILAPSIASAVPDASEYKRVKANRAVQIQNCVVNGVEGSVALKARLSEKRVNVSLPASFKRGASAVGQKRNKFAACGVSSDGTKTVLFLKKKADATPTEHELSLSSFKEQGSLGGACKVVRSFPGSFVYKTIGSTHFTDIRRNTIGLILKPGAGTPNLQCIDVLADNGQKVSDLGLYATGAGWHARYYGGIGCGDAINGNGLTSRVTKASGNNNVYFRFGSTCYGPIPANKCRGSGQC